MAPARLKTFVRGADGIISFIGDRVNEAALAAAGPRLKIVANCAIGYDNIDLAACAHRKVLVANAPGLQNVIDVADHVFALLLAVAHRIVEADRFTRAGRYHYWSIRLMRGQSITGKTMGIVGLGRIGCAVSQRAAGFSMPVLYAEVRGKNLAVERACVAQRVSLRALLHTADVVSLHIPLLSNTRHLIGRREFGWMKPTAILINTARGAVVDEAALVDALRTKKIAGAGLDVYEHEPKLTPGLNRRSNVVLTPHTASATVEARNELAVLAANNVLAALAGRRPPNLVSPWFNSTDHQPKNHIP
jgi:glyoxylate reductase